MALSAEVLHHFKNPTNAGVIDVTDQVGEGVIGLRACGGVWMKFQIQVVGGVVVDAKFKTYGCATSIACSQYVMEAIKGKRVDELSFIDKTFIDNKLTIMPHKKHCAELAEKVLKSAIEDYRSKNDNNN